MSGAAKEAVPIRTASRTRIDTNKWKQPCKQKEQTNFDWHTGSAEGECRSAWEHISTGSIVFLAAFLPHHTTVCVGSLSVYALLFQLWLCRLPCCLLLMCWLSSLRMRGILTLASVSRRHSFAVFPFLHCVPVALFSFVSLFFLLLACKLQIFHLDFAVSVLFIAMTVWYLFASLSLFLFCSPLLCSVLRSAMDGEHIWKSRQRHGIFLSPPASRHKQSIHPSIKHYVPLAAIVFVPLPASAFLYSPYFLLIFLFFVLWPGVLRRIVHCISSSTFHSFFSSLAAHCSHLFSFHLSSFQAFLFISCSRPSHQFTSLSSHSVTFHRFCFLSNYFLFAHHTICSLFQQHIRRTNLLALFTLSRYALFNTCCHRSVLYSVLLMLAAFSLIHLLQLSCSISAATAIANSTVSDSISIQCGADCVMLCFACCLEKQANLPDRCGDVRVC